MNHYLTNTKFFTVMKNIKICINITFFSSDLAVM